MRESPSSLRWYARIKASQMFERDLGCHRAGLPFESSNVGQTLDSSESSNSKQPDLAANLLHDLVHGRVNARTAQRRSRCRTPS